MTARPTTAADRAAREARIVAMRRARATWDAIGAAEGISPQRAGQVYRAALARNPLTVTQIDEHRAEEVELIDRAVQYLLGIALDEQTSPRTRVEAWSAIRGWAERKAKLLGLDCPARVEVVTLDHLDAQIAALEAELAAGAGGLSTRDDPTGRA